LAILKLIFEDDYKNCVYFVQEYVIDGTVEKIKLNYETDIYSDDFSNEKRHLKELRSFIEAIKTIKAYADQGKWSKKCMICSGNSTYVCYLKFTCVKCTSNHIFPDCKYGCILYDKLCKHDKSYLKMICLHCHHNWKIQYKFK
jgi:hypothetical protein